MRTSWFVASGLVLFACSMPVFAQEDKKTLDALLEAIDRMPSLYAKYQKPSGAELAKFPAAKLAEFNVGEPDSYAVQQKQWKAKKETYAKDHPLRAAVFTAVEAAEQTNRLPIRIGLARSDTSPKDKAAILQHQESLGIALFKLEKTLLVLKQAEEQRGQEKSKFWQAHFDWAQAQLEGDILFLFEYSFTLGQIRADNLPPLAAGDDGWRLAFLPKLRVTESKAKDLAKSRQKLLKKLQEDYADTPWSHFAERESRREVGMQWAAVRK